MEKTTLGMGILWEKQLNKWFREHADQNCALEVLKLCRRILTRNGAKIVVEQLQLALEETKDLEDKNEDRSGD